MCVYILNFFVFNIFDTNSNKSIYKGGVSTQAGIKCGLGLLPHIKNSYYDWFDTYLIKILFSFKKNGENFKFK